MPPEFPSLRSSNRMSQGDQMKLDTFKIDLAAKRLLIQGSRDIDERIAP